MQRLVMQKICSDEIKAWLKRKDKDGRSYGSPEQGAYEISVRLHDKLVELSEKMWRLGFDEAVKILGDAEQEIPTDGKVAELARLAVKNHT